jgi:hypothetical protein
MSSNYKKSGVDIDAGNELIHKIKPFAKATSRLGADSDLGGFGAIFDLKKCNFKDPVLVSSTDGVGTKLKVAIETKIHNSIGIDLFEKQYQVSLGKNSFLYARPKVIWIAVADTSKCISPGTFSMPLIWNFF